MPCHEDLTQVNSSNVAGRDKCRWYAIVDSIQLPRTISCHNQAKMQQLQLSTWMHCYLCCFEDEVVPKWKFTFLLEGAESNVTMWGRRKQNHSWILMCIGSQNAKKNWVIIEGRVKRPKSWCSLEKCQRAYLLKCLSFIGKSDGNKGHGKSHVIILTNIVWGILMQSDLLNRL